MLKKNLLLLVPIVLVPFYLYSGQVAHKVVPTGELINEAPFALYVYEVKPGVTVSLKQFNELLPTKIIASKGGKYTFNFDYGIEKFETTPGKIKYGKIKRNTSPQLFIATQSHIGPQDNLFVCSFKQIGTPYETAYISFGKEKTKKGDIFTIKPQPSQKSFTQWKRVTSASEYPAEKNITANNIKFETKQAKVLFTGISN